MTHPITIIVSGIPKPGGSKKGFPFRRGNGSMGVRIVEASKNGDWRNGVAGAGVASMAGAEPLTCPLAVGVTFNMPRPKSHYRKNGELKPDAPKLHTNKPDATKLWRSTEDALTGIVWRDDSQIAHQVIRKEYAARPGCIISVHREFI